MHKLPLHQWKTKLTQTAMESYDEWAAGVVSGDNSSFLTEVLVRPNVGQSGEQGQQSL
jgi:hypothetical protein